MTKPLLIKGIAYGSENEIFIRLDIEGTCEMRCSICNEWCEKKFSLKNYHAFKEKEDLPYWDFTDEIRETFLLEVPQFAECKGHCPKRSELQSFLVGSSDNFPFKGLE